MILFGALGVNILSFFNNQKFQKNRYLIDYYCVNNDDQKKRLLVLDNVSYHHAKSIQAWLEEMKDVKGLFFATIFTKIKCDRNVVDENMKSGYSQQIFESLGNLKQDLKMYCNQFEKINEELKLLTVFI